MKKFNRSIGDGPMTAEQYGQAWYDFYSDTEIQTRIEITLGFVISEIQNKNKAGGNTVEFNNLFEFTALPENQEHLLVDAVEKLVIPGISGIKLEITGERKSVITWKN